MLSEAKSRYSSGLKQCGNPETSGLNKILLILLTISCSLLTVDAQVQQQWAARYNGPGNGIDVAYSLAVDGSGNVYVTGNSDGAYATIKYNSSGDTLWVRRYNGQGAYSLAVDGSRNVYVTGPATIKYNSSGVQQWVAIYNDGVASSLAVDGSGHVYVTGSAGGGYATIKYNSSGVQQWVARYNLVTLAFASSLAVDGLGNVYVTGQSRGYGTSDDYATIKYNSSGDSVWVQRYNGPGNDFDAALSLAVDGLGNVYVTGQSRGSGTLKDYATIKYNSSGVQQWVSRYNGPANGDDQANSLAVDGSGNVYVTGWSNGIGSFGDYATIKYNSSGLQLWVSRYNGPANDYDEATSIALDASGNVYVTGWSYGGSGTDFDYATLKYNSAGSQQWVQRYNGPGNNDDRAYSLAVDSSGIVYVTGKSRGSGTNYDYATIKYSQFTGITPISNEIPNQFSLSQNYPNPFNPVTNVKFQIPRLRNGQANEAIVKLIVFDVLGREVATLVNEHLNAGTYEVNWDASNYPSGVYYYKLTTGEFTETRKAILIK